jgi:diguanylate cyclase (GGDEF)-like protein/PAS domain S-box-containing protein
MAWVPALVVVMAGATAAAACALRGRREPPGSRAPWIVLAVAIVLQAAQVAQPGSFGGIPALLPDLLQLVAAPLAVVGLLALPHPPADRFRRVQRASDAAVAALAFTFLTWELVLPAVLSDSQPVRQAVEGTTAIGAAAVATAAVYVLARAQLPGGLPFPTIGPVAGGLLSGVLGLVLVALAVAEHYRPVEVGGVIVIVIGSALVTYGASRPVRVAERPVDARRRERVAVLVPLLPLVLGGVMVLLDALRAIELSSIGKAFGLATLVLLLGGAILTRLDALRVARTLQARVEERTLVLGTREKWFRALVQHGSDVVTVLDADGTIRYMTPSGRRILGYDPERLVGLSFGRLLTPDGEELLAGALVACINQPGVSHDLELSVWHRDERWVLTDVTATSLLEDDDIHGLVLTMRDISEHRRLADQLTAQAHTDPLTGLANRTLFSDRVQRALEGAGAGRVAVLFVDLDGFKSVNDTQGHASGDRLLELVGRRLSGCVRTGDVVARLGGDEFGVLLQDDDVEHHAAWVARRIWRQLGSPFQLDGRTLTLGASTGLAVNDRGDETADQLLRNADLAMYKAKAAERTMFVRFEEEMHDALLARVRVESELRAAVAGGELAVLFQPVVDLDTGLAVGAEALVRWNHPTRGVVSPGDFIGLAEETGVVHELGTWILGEACRNAVQWQRFAPPGQSFHVGVNVSVRQLLPGWPRVVQAALAESGLPADALTLEVTESVLLERTDEALGLLRQLRTMGVGLALDDFGTGYSSLSYLSRVPVDVLKIDRSFVESVGRRGSEEAEVARTIVRLGTALRLTTVAEGIETAEQRAALLAMGCDRGQGYLFARPMSAAELTEYLTASLAATPVHEGSLLPAPSTFGALRAPGL